MDNTIDQGLAEAARRDLAIHTFALYYDHESPAISVCIDTAESSRRKVADINAYNRKYFEEAVAAGDLKTAALCRPISGAACPWAISPWSVRPEPNWRRTSNPILHFSC